MDSDEEQNHHNGTKERKQRGQLTPLNELNEILNGFPDGIDHAFGYGSGVFTQQLQPQSKLEEQDANGNSNAELRSSAPMVDLILATSDSRAWHKNNIQQNPSHYATIPRMLGTNFVTSIEDLGAGVYFNPLVDIEVSSSNLNVAGISNNDGMTQHRTRKQTIKYGVVSLCKLKRDLKEWEWMYLAGRMQKPTVTLNQSQSQHHNDEIWELQNRFNLKYALSASLLLLPSNSADSGAATIGNKHHPGAGNDYNTRQIYEIIASLSYMGDPRIKAGAEDPNKVFNLVNSLGQYQRFEDLYKLQFEEMERMGILTSSHSSGFDETLESLKSSVETTVQINVMDPSVRKVLWENLPSNLRQTTGQYFDYQYFGRENKGTTNNYSVLATSENNHSFNSSADYVNLSQKALAGALAKIVGPPARVQSAKGVITAGLYKSLSYVSAKFAKGLLR